MKEQFLQPHSRFQTDNPEYLEGITMSTQLSYHLSSTISIDVNQQVRRNRPVDGNCFRPERSISFQHLLWQTRCTWYEIGTDLENTIREIL